MTGRGEAVACQGEMVRMNQNNDVGLVAGNATLVGLLNLDKKF